MKIERLELKNFRNHKSTTIDLGRVNVFLGPNGAGKTSIKAALEYLLTGRVQEWTDRRGVGAADLIQQGRKKALVSAVLDGKKVTRHVPNKLEIEGASGSTSVQERLLSDFLGVSSDVMTALMNTTNFLELNAAEQKDMLLGLLGKEISRNSLTKMMAEAGASKTEIEECVKYVFYRRENETCGVGVLDELHDWVYDNRRSANRELRELEAAAAAAEKTGPIEGDGPVDAQKVEQARADLGAAKLHLKHLEEQYSILMTKKGQNEAADKAREALQAECEALSAEVKKLKEKTPHTKEELAHEIENIESSLKILRDSNSKKEVKLSELTSKIAVVESNISVISALKKSESCPIYGISCSITKKERTAAAKKLKRPLEKLKGEKAKVEAELAEIDKSRTKFVELLNKLKEELKIAREIEAKQKRILAIPREILSHKVDKDIDEKARELKRRIETGRAVIRAAEIAEARAGYSDEKIKKARAEAEKWDRLVAVFGPGGIKTKLLKSATQRLKEELNSRLELLTAGKYKADIEIEGSVFEIMINGLRIKLLSKSEKLRVGLIIQDALARLTGLKVLAIDDADLLRGPAKRDFQEFLARIEGDYDTIFVFASVDLATAPAGAFWVMEGRVA